MKAKKWELSKVPVEPSYILAFQLPLLPCKVGDLALRMKHCAQVASLALFLLLSETHESFFSLQSVLRKGNWKQKRNLRFWISPLPRPKTLAWPIVVLAAICLLIE